MSEPSRHTHPGDGTVPGLHGEPIPTPVLGCPACATVRSIGGELGAAPHGPAPSLAEFLLARIAEDEAVAKAASHLAPSGPDPAYVSLLDPLRVMQLRFDPARVLVECDAKRRIVDLAYLAGEEGAQPVYLRALRALALPYADHPDYREEWRP